MTKYVVMQARDQQDDGSRAGSLNWSRAPITYEAVSAEAAIRKAVDDVFEEGGTFIAIPMRSWNPVTVTVETKRQVILS